MQTNIQLRLAVPADVPALQRLIDVSVRGLQAHDYTPTQIEGALKTVFGIDSQLISDKTYFVAEAISSGSQGDQQEKASQRVQLSVAAVGANGKHFTAVTTGLAGKTGFSIRNAMPPRFAHFSSIRTGRDGVLAE